MVRKQLNIDAEQDRELKALAAERGVSESELVREALSLLLSRSTEERIRQDNAARFSAMLDEWKELSSHEDWLLRKPGEYRFGCYDEPRVREGDVHDGDESCP